MSSLLDYAEFIESFTVFCVAGGCGGAVAVGGGAPAAAGGAAAPPPPVEEKKVSAHVPLCFESYL